MKTLIELNALIFAASCGILYFVLKYRVHFHVEYSRRKRSGATGRTVVDPPPQAETLTPVSAQIKADLESALVNLGGTKEEAESRARSAMSQGPADFDALLLRAMQAVPVPEPGKRVRRVARRRTED